MTTEFYFCCDFLYTAVRVWFTLKVIKSIWEPKIEGKVQNLVVIVSMIVAGGFNTYNNSVIAGLFSNGGLLLIILFLAGIGSIISHLNYADVFCLVFLLWTGMTLFDFFFQTIAYTILVFFGLQPIIFLTATIHRGIYMLLYAMVLCGVALFVPKWGKKRSVRAVVASCLKYTWFLLIPLSACVVYFQRIYKMLVSELFWYRWWMFLLGGILLLLMALGYMVVRREKERFWLLQQKTGMVEQEYRMMRREYQEKDILLHDIGKHVRLIWEMAKANKTDEIIHYLDDLDVILQKGRNRELVNHDVLNLMLNSKFRDAEEVGIFIRYELDDMSALLMKPIEVCALFSNIMDNAIEANQALEEGEKRWIRLKCIRRGEMLILSASNPMPGKKIAFVEGIPQTSKKDKAKHGLGMQSIQQVVDIYEGDIQIKIQEGVFELMVHLRGFG